MNALFKTSSRKEEQKDARTKNNTILDVDIFICLSVCFYLKFDNEPESHT